MFPQAPHLPRQHTDINVVPMIDILLVLIIIFMLVSVTVIQIQLPTVAAAGDGTPNADDIVLSLPDSGGYALNGTAIDGSLLPDSLRAVFDDRPRKILFIQSGRTRQYHEVIAAMDVAKGSGVEVLSIMPNAKRQ